MSTVSAVSLAAAWETEVELGATAGDADVPSISPELVLVSPDLRERALAKLPDRSPDGWIPPPYVPRLVRPRVALALVEPAAVAVEADPDRRDPSVLLSAVLYALESAAHAAIMGGALVTLTVVLAILADVLHP